MSLFKEDTIKLPASAGKSLHALAMSIPFERANVEPFETTQTSTVCASSTSGDLRQADVRYFNKVHLRDGPMLSLLLSKNSILRGGVNCAYVVCHFVSALVLSHLSHSGYKVNGTVSSGQSRTEILKGVSRYSILVFKKYLLT